MIILFCSNGLYGSQSLSNLASRDICNGSFRSLFGA